MIYRFLVLAFATLLLAGCSDDPPQTDVVETPTNSEGSSGESQTSSDSQLSDSSTSSSSGSDASSGGTESQSGTSSDSSSASSSSSSVEELVATGPRPGSISDFLDKAGSDTVLFDFDKFDIRDDQQDTLRRQAAWLRIYRAASVTVEGHADERGTREYNLALGERRANAIKEFLVSMGVPAARVTTISYGKERPAAFGSNSESWAANRRSVTRVN